jgi:NAD/NADP transhydrogenase alpha subunit
VGIPYAQLSVGVAAESFPGELRVALTPANVKLLKSKGFREVLVESGCGFKAQFLDEDYKAAGATVTTRDLCLAPQTFFSKCDHRRWKVDLSTRNMRLTSFAMDQLSFRSSTRLKTRTL